jgi:nucleoporin NUP82
MVDYSKLLGRASELQAERYREYDVRRPDDPTQTFTCLPQGASASSSKFTAIDPLSRHATSFAFSPYTPSTYDFSALSITVLIANGDVYTMAPVLPLRAELPVKYLQGLKAYTKQRRRLAEVKKDGYEIDRVDTWDLWISSLIKQYKDGNKEESVKRTSRDGRREEAGEKADIVKLHPPHLTATGGPAPGVHRALVRQGPVIFSPGPQEADDEDEEIYASDIVILSSSTRDDDGEEGSTSEDVKAMSIVWSSGRVDTGLLMDAAEPVWVEEHVSGILT